MRWSIFLFLAACAAPTEVEHTVLRQAFSGMPVLTGLDGGRLGSSLASCPGSGFVAGEPGQGRAVTSLNTGFPPGPPNSLGLTVACDGVSGSPILLSGGAGGFAQLGGTGSNFSTPGRSTREVQTRAMRGRALSTSRRAVAPRAARCPRCSWG